MASVDLAAASLGAAAPVPVSPAPAAAPADRFSDILADLNGTRAAISDAEGAPDANAPGPAAPVPPTWDALEQIARQLTLSTAWTSSAATPRAMRKAAPDATDAEAAPAGAAADPATSAAAMTVCVIPEFALKTSVLDEGVRAAISTSVSDAPAALVEDPAVSGETPGAPDTAVDPAAGMPMPVAAASTDVATVTDRDYREPLSTPSRPEIALPLASDPKPAAHTSVTDRKDAGSSPASARTTGSGETTTVGAAFAASLPVEGGPRQDLPQGEGRSGERKADRDQPGVRMAAARTTALSPASVNPKALAERFRANESAGEAASPVGTKFSTKPMDAAPAPARERSEGLSAASMRIDVPTTQGPNVSAARAVADVSRPAAADADTRLDTQIVQALKLHWGSHGGEATIRLQPHYLGDLTVSLRVENGSVVAQLAASSPEVRHWIENNEALLRQSLSAQDLELERLTVVDEESTPAPSDENAREPQNQDAPRRRPRQRDADATFEVVV